VQAKFHFERGGNGAPLDQNSKSCEKSARASACTRERKLMGRPRSVLISGAGIAGPTLAYWLLRAGFVPTLIETAPRFREGGYMIDFWSVGSDVAEKMNLLPRLREIGYHLNRIKFVDEAGRTRSELGGRVFRDALGERFISLQRGDLAQGDFRFDLGQNGNYFR
jgi:NADPH-dependent 2,4-dienoyl-CoA reductase/sulfur reductase-like enzyme